MKKNGDYIYLIFDSKPHPFYIKGHVSLEYAQGEIDRNEEDIVFRKVTHKFGRLISIGPDHDDCLYGLTNTFRVIDKPRASYYPVTECEL